MANTYLTRSISSGSDLTKWTWSCWVKRTDLVGVGNNYQRLISNEHSGDNNKAWYIRFQSSTQFHGWVQNSAFEFTTNGKYRDINGWYHLVVKYDSTQSTQSNRLKVYVNGEEPSMSAITYPSQNQVCNFMNSNVGYVDIGYYRQGSSEYFHGLMSHMHFTAGYAYDASAFGETDATTGEWKIKTSPSVTYGNNGFFILKDGNSVTDASTNSNNFTVAGGTLTKTEDNPSNVFATLNPLHTTGITGNYFLSLGNLRQNVTDNDGHRETGFTLHPKGLKGYFEVKCTVDPNFHLGLQNVASALGKTNYYTLASSNYYYMQASNPVKISYANGGSSANHIADYFSQISVGDIIGCAFDFTGTNKNVWFHKNGTYGSSGGYVGNPANGTYPAMSSTQLTADEYEFIISPNTGSGNGQLDFNFGNGYFGTTAVSSAGTNASNNGIFEYDVPSGFTALSTKGLNL